MPDRIASIIAHEDKQNKLQGVIPKIAQLLEQENSIDTAYLCTPSAIQVFKLSNEGNHFCGYRNIQMLLLGAPTNAASRIPEAPTIPLMQELIETAWDAGFNSHGRTQTGGIKGSRKRIGTSEAEALLLSLGIPCTGSFFSGKNAQMDLLNHVEKYFSASAAQIGTGFATHAKIRQTDRPPIFLQRPDHSITIVGLEKLNNAKRRLLVFDPAWNPPSAMRQAEPLELESRLARAAILWRYRKHTRYLRRFAAFETLIID